ncbi:MAG: hypothetical protein WBY53_17885 [Acidobacteriaceae bacterium]
MLRIGVMLDSWTTNAWVAAIIEDIQASQFAHVSLVILNTPAAKHKPSISKWVKDHWNLSLYDRYEKWDYQKYKTAPDAMAPCDLESMLSGSQSIRVNPVREGSNDLFREEDIAQIRAANLDVVLRFGFRILRGEILHVARCGIWSFHHDDNLRYRGRPPLFWEMYDGNPVSGSMLQILNETLDGGHVIYRSYSATDFTSLYRNRNPIYWKTSEFVLRRLHDLNSRGWKYIESLDSYAQRDSYGRRIYRIPNTFQMGVFLWRLLLRSVRIKTSGRFSSRFEQWFLAIRKRSPDRSFESTLGYQIVRPPLDRFYADPFLFRWNNKSYLFFEDYRYRDAQAHISCAEVGSDGTLRETSEALRRPYHLSYPFLIEYEGDIYMIPETRQNRSVELYRADEFPTRWSLAAVLLTDVVAVDATIHQAGGKFWMFVGLSNGKFSSCDELGIFYANSLFGPWSPHPSNPVISDVRRARPAGALFYQDGKLIRPSQDCSKAYGYAICFSEVLVLDETGYSEVPIGRIDPDWTSNNLGSHTYSRSDGFEIIDGKSMVKSRRSMRSGDKSNREG